MFANLDGISKEKNIVVDAKTARNKDEWGREFTSEMPTDYIYQMAHYCAVMNAPEAHVIVFFKNNEKYGIYKYMRNEDFETAIIKKEKEFWEEFVLKNKVPPMRKIQEVKENFAYAEEDIAIADTEAKKKFKRLLEIEKQKKSLSAMEEALKLDLMLEIGIKKELQDEYGNKLITWGNVTAKRLDSTKLKNKKPEIYNEFLVEQSYRRFSPNYKYMEPN
jgi:predicted phage-related endonuclease